jgi:Raf kinase inhibitor-like YbhB/YbcL family protein
MIDVKSKAFERDHRIPRRHSSEGENVAPPITWNCPADNAAEFALICDDPDAPREKPFVHWVVYKIPGAAKALATSDPDGAVQGRNDFGRVGYGGPLPPPGHGTHHYHFKVYALDKALDLGPGASKDELLAAMRGHVVDEGELVGTYER